MKYNTPIVFVLTALLILSACSGPTAELPLNATINADWTFSYDPAQEDRTDFAQPGFNDSHWPAIALPHTWSTYETTGEVHPFIHSAAESDDPYWWYGWGYYRKTFQLDKSLKGKKVFVEFDGVQKYSKIYLNGEYLGDHKGGFTSFHFDLSDAVNWEGENILSIAVSNRRNDEHHIPPMTAGNWNVYGGIYRDVRLVVKDRLYIPYQGSYQHEGGTFITTPEVNAEKALVNILTWVKNEYDEPVSCELKTSILDPKGNTVQELQTGQTIDAGELTSIEQTADPVEDPLLWHPDHPNLYRVETALYMEGVLVDRKVDPLGFRWYSWDYENDDLHINGKKMNILGVNRHQEYPWLGDAHPKWVARMDMYDIKYNLGHNFMRLTHYPNDKYLYQLADSFGIVMVEEVPNIKSIDFDEEVQEQNVREMIRRDRNHPSIFFWSMGNETSDAADSRWAWEEDTTRIIHLRKGDDGGGDYYTHDHRNLDMENLLRVTVRGWFDVDDAPEGFSAEPKNGQHSSTETWQHQMARIRGGSVRGLLGDNCVLWLYEDHGADREYLNCILKHINPKGLIDMYRQPKYLYHLTKALYSDNPTVYIHPHFWRSKYIGQERDIQVDANLESVELFVNGTSLGKKTPDEFKTITFPDVTITEGLIRAEGTLDGKTHSHEVHMPGEPASLQISTSHTSIPADRSGLAIVTATILDADGNEVFDARNTLEWEVEGPGKYVGYHTYESDIMKYEEWEGTGYTVVPVANVVRSTAEPGTIQVRVSSEGLATAELEIRAVGSNDALEWLQLPILSDAGREPVKRDPDYTSAAVIINELLTIRENHRIEGSSFNEYRRNIAGFIQHRNRFNQEAYGYQVLLDELARKLVSLEGELIADDYNYLINQYNIYYELEKAVKRGVSAPDEKREEIMAKFADEIIVKSRPVDLEAEKRKLKEMSF